MLKTLSVAGFALSSVLTMNGAQAASELEAQEQADLLFMREEEQLARDVYLTLADQWGIRVFSNIARSEQRHMDSVGNLLDFYDLEDPLEGGVEVGVFENEDLQVLYNQLVDQGSVSQEAALLVGKQIEELDIEDLNQALEDTDETKIQQVYNNLLTASEKHLRAFNRQLGSDEDDAVVVASSNADSQTRRRRSGRGFGRQW